MSTLKRRRKRDEDYEGEDDLKPENSPTTDNSEKLEDSDSEKPLLPLKKLKTLPKYGPPCTSTQSFHFSQFL